MVTTIRLPDELHEKLREKAREKGMTLNAYLISVLWNVEEGMKWRQDGNGMERRDVG